MYVAKTKALISFAVTAKLICVFVFAYAKGWFSHDAAHLVTTMQTKEPHQNKTYLLLMRKQRSRSAAHSNPAADQFLLPLRRYYNRSAF